jgi:hypothetical protein
MMLKKN